MNQIYDILIGLLLPLLGTTLGAAAVFFMQKKLRPAVSDALNGFAAGVMTAASVWSLILPAIEQSASLHAWSFVPAFVGFWLGILFLIALSRATAPLDRLASASDDALPTHTLMTVLAVTLHNIPEGMAVGVAYAGCLSGRVSSSAALALALGIAIQNYPEGAIISMPLHAGGCSKPRAFFCGWLSGVVEPIFGLLTVLFSSLITPLLPYLLAFAAGAMIYVVVKELIPEMASGEREHTGAVCFGVGFTLMMALDVALG